MSNSFQINKDESFAINPDDDDWDKFNADIIKFSNRFGFAATDAAITLCDRFEKLTKKGVVDV